MNIGIVTTWFDRGAAYVSRQYRKTLSASHTVFVFDRGEHIVPPSKQWDVENVTRCKKPRIRQHVDIHLRQFRKWLIRHKIDLVIFNEQHWWPPVILARDLGVKTAAYVDYYTERTLPAFGLYDLLICNTKRHQAAFDWHPQVCYIPWGTDIELFRPKPPNNRRDKCLIFFHNVGMSPYRKGTDLVFQAFQRLSEDVRLVVHTQLPFARYNLIGSETWTRIENDSRISIVHKTVSPPGLYHLGDVYVYPTRLEGIGLSVPEALACGLPCIVPDHPPMNEFVQHGFNGRLVAIERLTARYDGYYWPQCHAALDSLTASMQWYIDHAADLPGLSELAREAAVKRLDWGRNSAGLTDVVQSANRLDGKVVDSARQCAIDYENSRSLMPRVARWLTRNR